jgi:hypothetical protein
VTGPAIRRERESSLVLQEKRREGEERGGA